MSGWKIELAGDVVTNMKVRQLNSIEDAILFNSPGLFV